jgi:acetyltransferase-like isoleucine patch superfamily enzyme
VDTSILARCGDGTTVAPTALILRPEAVELGAGVTVEPFAFLEGDDEGELRIGDGTLIGPHTYLQGLGGIRIGRRVGVGAGAVLLTAVHAETAPGGPITDGPLRYGAVEVGDGCDIGVGALLLPGTSLGPGTQVGAGAVVRGRHAANSVIAGVPARRLRGRGDGDWAKGLATTPPGRRRAGA